MASPTEADLAQNGESAPTRIRNAPYSKATFEAWHSRHKQLPFSPAWNPLLIEWMRDAHETSEARSLAWTILRGPGNHSDRPRDENGNELGRSDCARETGQAPQRVSEAFQGLHARGFVDFEGRSIILREDPSEPRAGGPPQTDKRGPNAQYRAFKTQFLIDNPEVAEELEEAQALVKSLNYKILKAYMSHGFIRTPRTKPTSEDDRVYPDTPDKTADAPGKTEPHFYPDTPDKTADAPGKTEPHFYPDTPDKPSGHPGRSIRTEWADARPILNRKSEVLKTEGTSQSVSPVEEAPPTDRPTYDPTLEAIAEAISPWAEKLGEMPTRKLLEDIRAGFRGGPLAEMLEALTAMIQRKEAKLTGLGLLAHFADAIGQTWKAGEKKRAAAAVKERRKQLDQDEDSATEARRVLADPTAPEDLKTLARETLRGRNGRGASA
jgi:hypothetical protein